MSRSNKPYDHLRAWCYMMGSSDSYTRDQIALARDQGAPDDAVYRRHGTGEWATFSEVTNPATIRTIEARVEAYREARTTVPS